MSDPLLLNSVTDAQAALHAGQVAMCGSHGGLIAGVMASRAGLRAVLLNDAGIGLNQAGIAGVMALAQIGMAAVAIDSHSARIADAADMLGNGIVSAVNAVAETLGVEIGQTASEALARLAQAPAPSGQLAAIPEARTALPLTQTQDGPSVILADSASLVTAEDAGRVIVTGSHGGLIGGDPRRALKAMGRLAVFNDAGVAKDQSGITRLPALDSLDIAACAVSHWTAEIGSAAMVWQRGVISAVNATARAQGLRPGDPLQQAVRDHLF